MWSDITFPPINLYNAPRSLFLSRQDPFKTSLAKNVFKQKYALHQSQSWYEKARDIVNDVCGVTDVFKYPLMSKEDRDQLVQYIYELKFLPGGRYIYYAGRKARYYNNCFSADQEFITSEGVKAFNEFEDGEEAWVLSPVSGAFHQATVNCHGEQDLYEITFSNIRGRSKKTWTVKATRDHRWILKDGTETTSLKVGDVVPAGGYGMQMYDPKGWLHGAVFADGGVIKRKNSYSHQLRLCGEKSKYLEKLQNLDNVSVTYPPFAKGDPVLYITSPYSLKELPKKDESTIYISSFISGWVALDGHDDKVKQLHSINKEAMEYFSKYAYTAGLVVTGDLKVCTKDSNFGKRKPLYHLNFKSYNEFGGFKVISIKYLGKDKVWCVNEPRHNQFLLADGIVTGNCFLLKCEEDTREEWAAVTQRALSCLTTGGGIGIDYSVLRPAGRVLSRTGGLSSGPIPLMYIINEVGRNVMQGGSRRSAIYASLNWQHEDSKDFLTVKNWDTMPITRDYSFWDAKMDNFNFPCPLDMTNISLNYDNAFLNKIGDYHEYNGEFTFQVNNSKPLPGTFIKNVEQALRTGEPGFSFNFGDKENETLRNACTEVTSEDDSDV